MQYEGTQLEVLARTGADRIFFNRRDTWHGEEEYGTTKDVKALVNEAVYRCKLLRIPTRWERAEYVLLYWGSYSTTTSDEDE